MVTHIFIRKRGDLVEKYIYTGNPNLTFVLHCHTQLETLQCCDHAYLPQNILQCCLPHCIPGCHPLATVASRPRQKGEDSYPFCRGLKQDYWTADVPSTNTYFINVIGNFQVLIGPCCNMDVMPLLYLNAVTNC